MPGQLIRSRLTCLSGSFENDVWWGSVGALRGPHGPFQGGNQGRALTTQFGLMSDRQLPQHLFALGSETQQYLTPIFTRAVSPHQPAGGQPVHEFDRAVVLDLHSFSQCPDSRAHSGRQALEHQHQLVLLRFQAHFPGSLFTEAKKQANLIAQFRQCLIVGKGQSFFHAILNPRYIVTRYILGGKRPTKTNRKAGSVPIRARSPLRRKSSDQMKRSYALTTLPLRRQEVQTRIRLVAAPTLAWTGRRFTFQRRLVTLWAWLMLFPNCGPLPQISHTCAMDYSR